MNKKLTDFSVLTFDCYGTLIDWETGIWDALQPLIKSNGTDPQREDVLAAYGELEHEQESRNGSMPYSKILLQVHANLAKRLELRSSTDLDAQFAHALRSWPAFPDSATALRFLKKHYKLVILSNVDNAGIAASIEKLGVDFDAVYTAEDIGSYKPDDGNFRFLLEALQSDFGFAKEEVLHTAQSLLHDHTPANRFGIANAWIDRQRLSQGGSWGATAPLAEMPAVDYRFFSLAEMAEAVQAA